MRGMFPRAAPALALSLVAGTALANDWFQDPGHDFIDLDKVFPHSERTSACLTPRIVKQMTAQQRSDCKLILRYGPTYFDNKPFG